MKQLPFEREFLPVTHNRGKKKASQSRASRHWASKERRERSPFVIVVVGKRSQGYGERNRDAILWLPI